MQAPHTSLAQCARTVASSPRPGVLVAGRALSARRTPTGKVVPQSVPWSVPLVHRASGAHARVHAGREVSSTDVEIARLTDAIVTAENKLAALFEPGKPMPRAGIVAAARQEVSDMKAQLAALMGGAAAASAGVSDGALTDDELAEKARQAFLEVERMLGQKTGMSSRRDDATAIAVLEAENERLRVEATALLVRQQQLEELVASVIAKGKAAASNN